MATAVESSLNETDIKADKEELAALSALEKEEREFNKVTFRRVILQYSQRAEDHVGC